MSAPGEVCSQGGVGSAPGGCLIPGGVWSWRGLVQENPPGQLLLLAVRIILECILVVSLYLEHAVAKITFPLSCNYPLCVDHRCQKLLDWLQVGDRSNLICSLVV